MGATFKDCLARKRIFAFEAAKHLTPEEIKDAEGDLQSAKEEFSKKGYKMISFRFFFAFSVSKIL